MGQQSYTYPANGMVGQLGASGPNRIITVSNPLRAQTTNLEYNGITTDGSYQVHYSGTDGSSGSSVAFVASSNTAAQICAGVAAGINASPSFAGVTNTATVITTDNVLIPFVAPGIVYTLTFTSPGSSPTQSNTVTAGYTNVAPGIILQSLAGSFTVTYSDAKLAYGVTVRNADMVQPLDYSGIIGWSGPSEVGCLAMGEIPVQVVSGVSVLKGETAYFDPSNATWSNTTTGSSVLVENSMWMTSGTGVQRVFVNFPSST
jgi:hypothetical protein